MQVCELLQERIVEPEEDQPGDGAGQPQPNGAGVPLEVEPPTVVVGVEGECGLRCLHTLHCPSQNYEQFFGIVKLREFDSAKYKREAKMNKHTI